MGIPAPSIPVYRSPLPAVVGAATGHQLFAGVPWEFLAITGELKSRIDAVWNRFSPDAVFNLLALIQQIPYLLLVHRPGRHPNGRGAMSPAPLDRAPCPPLGPSTPVVVALQNADDGQKMYEVISDQVFPFLRREVGLEEERR
ncbi:hypothetical protein [Kocuria nitroreducens]|uniref:hypothetical protein n=1 Tax=Kocuria nitroreducens TaxID=3058914 RepID=UPI0036DF4495